MRTDLGSDLLNGEGMVMISRAGTSGSFGSSGGSGLSLSQEARKRKIGASVMFSQPNTRRESSLQAPGKSRLLATHSTPTPRDSTKRLLPSPVKEVEDEDEDLRKVLIARYLTAKAECEDLEDEIINEEQRIMKEAEKARSMSTTLSFGDGGDIMYSPFIISICCMWNFSDR
jgi:hypothetical protein